MNYTEFIQLRKEGTVPEDIPVLLQAILLDAEGDWSAAHRIAQNEFTPDGFWVHAYLHRKEGDMSNARYWYNNAGRIMPESSLEQEWELIAKNLTASNS